MLYYYRTTIQNRYNRGLLMMIVLTLNGYFLCLPSTKGMSSMPFIAVETPQNASLKRLTNQLHN